MTYGHSAAHALFLDPKTGSVPFAILCISVCSFFSFPPIRKDKITSVFKHGDNKTFVGENGGHQCG